MPLLVAPSIWTRQPPTMVPLESWVPQFEVFCVPTWIPRDIGLGSSPMRDVVSSNGYADLDNITLYGVGRHVFTGFGWGVDSAFTKGSRTRAYAIACFYTHPGTAAGTLRFMYNLGLGAGSLQIGVSAAGLVNCVANDNNFGNVGINFSATYDCRDKLTCVAFTAEMAGGVQTIRASINGLPAQENTRASADPFPVGQHLEINDGNGFNGMTGTILYAGQSWADAMLSHGTLQDMSVPFGIFEPEQNELYWTAGGIVGPLIGARHLINSGALIGGRLAA